MTSQGNKYRAKKTKVDGKTFHSKKEAFRYTALKMMERQGLIQDLICQPRIPLEVNGKIIGHYVGDFKYWDGEKFVLEDVKSPATKTPLYKLKKKILETYDPPINIIEIM